MAARTTDSLYPLDGRPGFGADFRRNGAGVIAAIDALNAKAQQREEDEDEVVEEKNAALSRSAGTSVPVAGRRGRRTVPQATIDSLEQRLAKAIKVAEASIEATHAQRPPLPQLASAGSNGGCCCPCHLLEGRTSDNRSSYPYGPDGLSVTNPEEDVGTLRRIWGKTALYHPFAYDFWAHVASVDKNQIAFHAWGAIGLASALYGTYFFWSRILLHP